MNRIIKFRAWDEEKKEFIKNMLYVFDKSACTNGRLFKDDIILQQFTGLLDKNGKEIYEGDLVEVIFEIDDKRNYVGQVDFHYGQFWVVRHNGYGGEGYDFEYLLNRDRYNSTANLKVIGNIYQNKNLIK